MSHVAIISASVGAGHDGAAAELARRLGAAGYKTDRYDLLDLLPRSLAQLLTTGYYRQLTAAPWSYQATVRVFDRAGPTGFAAWAVRGADRPILRLVRPDTVAVVSTYPLASQALGRLRRSGSLRVPAISYLTDPSVHRIWIAAGVDACLAGYDVTAAQARRLGAAGVRRVAPAVPPDFRPAGTRAEIAAARRAFRLPPTGKLALVVAGSLGLGRPELTAREIAGTGLATPVVVCGRHRALHQRLSGVPGLVALGWVDEMPTLLRAVDLVVHNGGGLTSLEALATGLPVLTYRPLAGHGRANASILDRAGIIPWIRCPAQLPAVLRRTLEEPTPVPVDRSTDPAEAIVDCALAR
jgi:UDP-N-acetylglucosamine:LPS N-acetylglucosamine transferase